MNVASCCFCINLETGGKIFGWVGIILGVLITLFGAIAASVNHEHPVLLAYYSAWAVVAVATVITSSVMIKGITQKSANKVMPARIVAIVSYLVLPSIVFYAMFTSSLEDSITESVLAMGKFGRHNESLVRLFTKEAVDNLRNTRLIPTLAILFFDFVFRFMVIESLHNKFKGQPVPTTSFKV